MPLTSNRHRPLALTVLLLLTAPALLSPLAAAGSHSRLTVGLWNEEALGKGSGDTFVVWAQVYDGQTPVNVTTLKFKLGLEFPPIVFAVVYNGTYAGSPGLYNATVTVSAQDELQGITVLSAEATSGVDFATSTRLVILEIPGGGPFGSPPSPWNVHVGVENFDDLQGRVDPGERLVWRIDTTFNGVPTNSSTLSAVLFEAPHVTFTEAAIPLTPVNVGPGVYEVQTTVPANPPGSLEMVVQVHVSDSNDAWSNGTADLWFHDTVVDFTTADNARLAGTLTIGDGQAVLQGLAVDIAIVEDGNPGHQVGTIAGTTDSAGQLSFNITNDGTTSLMADGWVNGSTLSQRVWRQFAVRDLVLVQTPDGSRFDAVALSDPSQVPWQGVQSFPFEFWDNGSLYTSAPLNAYVWNSRGSAFATSVTTDSQGRANVSVDFDTFVFGFDDVVQGGLNVTFRIPQGPNASASDGIWWGEDEEHIMIDPTLPFIDVLVDTNLSFVSDTFNLGAPFGVGAKYTGSQSVSGWVGGAALFPGGFINAIGDVVDRYAVWTGTDMPFVTYMQGGVAGEFFGCANVPSYWPSTTYSLVGVVTPSLAALSSEQGLPEVGALYWADVDVGTSVAQFTPSADTTAPVVGPVDPNPLVDLGQPLSLSAYAYDDSLDFCSAGNYTWTFDDPFAGQVAAYGPSPTVTLPHPGVIPANLTVTDGTGNAAVVAFTVTVTDRTAPVIVAGPDQTVLVGDLVTFGATGTDDDPRFPGFASFDWLFDDQGTPVNLIGQTVTYTFNTRGVYNVSLLVMDASGNSATDALQVTVNIPDAEPPAVDAGPDQTVRVGTAVAFAGSATDNDPLFPAGSQVQWNFSYNGSIVTLSGLTPTFTFDIPGTYLVSLEVLDATGNPGLDTVTIDVIALDVEPPTVDAGQDWNVVAGTVIDFLGSAADADPLWPSGAVATWSFDYGGTTHTFTGYSFSFQFDTPGTYVVTLDVADGSGNVGSDTATATVILPDTTAPTITPIADMEVMTGVAVSFVATATDDSPDFGQNGTFNWTFTAGGAAQDLSGSSVSFTFTVAETVDVTLTVRDGAGNAATETFQVRVRAPDTTPPSIVLAHASITVQAGQEVVLSASASDGGNPITTVAAFVWTFEVGGSPVTLTGGQATYTFDTPGTYNITLRVTDAAGNVGTAHMEVNVTEATSPTTGAGGLDAMLLLGVVLAIVVVAGLGYALTRKRGAPPGGSSGEAPEPAEKEE
jgi:PKD repeat protein